MKRIPIAIAALLTIALAAPANAASVTVLVKKTDGVRVETTVTPGPKLLDTIIPGTAGRSTDKPNSVSDHCMTGVLFVSPGDAPGTKYPAINVDENCNPLVLATGFVGGTPATVIDNGFGPDVVTTTNIPTCTRKFKTISTSRPFLSATETTTDGAC